MAQNSIKSQPIMVVGRQRLFQNDHFTGFKAQNKINYLRRILTNYKYKERSSVEDNPSYKQPIAYGVIANPKTKYIFAYQRAGKNEHYKEKRLANKWSLGVGGHIEKTDSKSENPITASLKRELAEEVGLKPPINYKLIGYINFEFGVHSVHFGLLYIINTNLKKISPKSAEITSGKLISLSELENLINSEKYEIEDWSRAALEPIKEYLLVSQ
jgi:predicted NUDIX family phosphoesterase